jgi:glycosyltransferase involved in cell wall biosynthesis
MSHSVARKPAVAIVTPVYDGEKVLATAIESVLAQTWSDFEYHIVDNCSRDGTRDLAEDYARRDRRIQVHTPTEFVDVVASHNRALTLGAQRSDYVKCVDADDWLFPRCVAEMVDLMEAHPTMGMVCAYVLYGNRVAWDGLPYPSTFLTGRDVSRKYFLDDIKAFGGPTASMIRSSVVLSQQPFYAEGRYNGDTEAYLKLLQKHDFGFVHQVLTFKAGGEDSPTTHRIRHLNPYAASNVEELVRFGPACMSPDEYRGRLARELGDYYAFLAEVRVKGLGADVWAYHDDRMKKLGMPISKARLARAIAAAVLDRLLNPKRTLEGLLRPLFRHEGR